MEEGSSKKMRAICVMLVIIMLGMFAKESEAFSGKCYRKCLFKCVINPFHNPVKCAIKCLGKCFFKPPGSSASLTSLSLNDQLHNRCTFACAKTKCANITTSAQNIREDEVEGCVKDCSNTCIKKH